MEGSIVDELLRRQRTNGGWAYNRQVPTDCDSTAWVLLGILPFIQTTASPAVARALQYLIAHQQTSSGGFSTYSAFDGIQTYIGAPGLSSVQGWMHAHPCVSGSTLQALLGAGEERQSKSVLSAVRYIELHRDSSLWRSYWWEGCAYSTYQCLKALLDAEAVSRSDVRIVGSALLLGRNTSEHLKQPRTADRVTWARCGCGALCGEDCARPACHAEFRWQLVQRAYP